MASIVTQQEKNVQEKEKKRKPSPYNNNKKKTNKTTKQTQLNDDSDDPKTKSFKAIIKLIGKTITKKPKNKAKRLEFSNLVQENEQKVFEIIRGNPMPIIYIFQFLEYIYKIKKSGLKIGGRMLYYLSRILHDNKTSEMKTLQKYAMDIILNKKIDYAYYADIILYLNLIIDDDNKNKNTSMMSSSSVSLLTMNNVLQMVLEMFDYEQKKYKNYCKSTVNMITKLCLHDYFEPERFIKVLMECKNQNVISLQNLLCKEKMKYQVCLIHYAWDINKDLKRATKLIKLFKIDPYINYPVIVRRNYENQLRWIIREGIFDLASNYLNKYDITTADGFIKSEELLSFVCNYGYKVLGKDHPVLQSWVQLYRKRQYNNNIHNTNFNIAKFASVQNPPQDFIICNFDDPTKDVKNDYLDVNKYLDPKNDIKFIDNREDAIEAMQHLINSKVVGFDSEWRPTSDVFLTENGTPALEIFQLSSLKKCYLFDCQLDKLRLYGDLMLDLMTNKDIVKVGYAVSGDTSKLKSAVDRAYEIYGDDGNNDNSYNHNHNNNNKNKNTNETTVGDKGSTRRKKKSFQFENINDIQDRKIAGGLAGTVKHYMEKPLKKTQQMSNWKRRPLMYEQLIYAALDAFTCAYIYTLQLNQKKEEFDK